MNLKRDMVAIERQKLELRLDALDRAIILAQDNLDELKTERVMVKAKLSMLEVKL